MYNVWLVRSEEYSQERFLAVMDLLLEFPGVVFFKTKNKYVEKSEGHQEEAENWFFEKCNKFRTEQDIGNKDVVVYLTDIRNTRNHFNGIDFGVKENIFVQTSDWEHYMPKVEEKFPIAYHIAVSVLIRKWFINEDEALQMLKAAPEGCIMDANIKKKEVGIKIRTASISQVAIDSLKTKEVDSNLINQVLAVLDGIRQKVIDATRPRFKPKPLKMKIDKSREYKITFPELNNLEIKLSPLQKAFYLLYLENLDGINPKYLTDFNQQYTDYYNSFRPKRDPKEVREINKKLNDDKKRKKRLTGQVRYELKKKIDDYEAKVEQKRKKTIENILDPSEKGFEQQFSKIKSEFISKLGAELADLYYIKGEIGEVRKIEFNRDCLEKIDW